MLFRSYGIANFLVNILKNHRRWNCLRVVKNINGFVVSKCGTPPLELLSYIIVVKHFEVELSCQPFDLVGYSVRINRSDLIPIKLK